MLYSGTDPESYITEYTLVYEEKLVEMPFDKRLCPEQLLITARDINRNVQWF